LRHQTQFALGIDFQDSEEYKAVILMLAHLAEVSLSEAEIAKLQLREMRMKCEGKRAVKSDRRVLSKAQVITGADIIRLKEELERKALARTFKLKKEKDRTPTSTHPQINPSTRYH
jgi:hypothetical protein